MTVSTNPRLLRTNFVSYNSKTKRLLNPLLVILLKEQFSSFFIRFGFLKRKLWFFRSTDSKLICFNNLLYNSMSRAKLRNFRLSRSNKYFFMKSSTLKYPLKHFQSFKHLQLLSLLSFSWLRFRIGFLPWNQSVSSRVDFINHKTHFSRVFLLLRRLFFFRNKISAFRSLYSIHSFGSSEFSSSFVEKIKTKVNNCALSFVLLNKKVFFLTNKPFVWQVAKLPYSFTFSFFLERVFSLFLKKKIKCFTSSHKVLLVRCKWFRRWLRQRLNKFRLLKMTLLNKKGKRVQIKTLRVSFIQKFKKKKMKLQKKWNFFLKNLPVIRFNNKNKQSWHSFLRFVFKLHVVKKSKFNSFYFLKKYLKRFFVWARVSGLKFLSVKKQTNYKFYFNFIRRFSTDFSSPRKWKWREKLFVKLARINQYRLLRFNERTTWFLSTSFINRSSFKLKKFFQFFLEWRSYALRFQTPYYSDFYKFFYRKKKHFFNTVVVRFWNRLLLVTVSFFKLKKRPISRFEKYLRDYISKRIFLISNKKQKSYIYKMLSRILYSLRFSAVWSTLYEFPLFCNVQEFLKFDDYASKIALRVMRGSFFIRHYFHSYFFINVLLFTFTSMFYRNPNILIAGVSQTLAKLRRHRQYLFFIQYLLGSVLWRPQLSATSSDCKVHTVYMLVRGKVNSGTRTKLFKIFESFKPSSGTLKNHISTGFGVANAQTGTFGIQVWFNY